MLKNDADDLSKYVIERFWQDGWSFFDYWKARILAVFSILCIIVLCFVEVNSYMIQEFLAHTLVSSAIVDYINKYRDRKREEQEKKERIRKEKKEKGEIYDESDDEKDEQQILTRILSKSQILETYSPPTTKPRFKDTLDFSIMDDYG
jgi:hypothetical protein